MHAFFLLYYYKKYQQMVPQSHQLTSLGHWLSYLTFLIFISITSDRMITANTLSAFTSSFLHCVQTDRPELTSKKRLWSATFIHQHIICINWQLMNTLHSYPASITVLETAARDLRLRPWILGGPLLRVPLYAWIKLKVGSCPIMYLHAN